jgi:hypothetical protein
MTLRPLTGAAFLLYAARKIDRTLLVGPQSRKRKKPMHLATTETGLQLVAAIVLAGIILFELRTAVVALNNADRYYTAFTLVLASAVVCLAVLSR